LPFVDTVFVRIILTTVLDAVLAMNLRTVPTKKSKKRNNC
jgi:hypothetical protein